VEIVDLDLLFQSPQKDARIIGGMEEEALEDQQWRSISSSRTLKHLGKKTPFIALKDIYQFGQCSGTSVPILVQLDLGLTSRGKTSCV
jgi:hypothetical protein